VAQPRGEESLLVQRPREEGAAQGDLDGAGEGARVDVGSELAGGNGFLEQGAERGAGGAGLGADMSVEVGVGQVALQVGEVLRERRR
jgi:hypothetical protein